MHIIARFVTQQVTVRPGLAETAVGRFAPFSHGKRDGMRGKLRADSLHGTCHPRIILHPVLPALQHERGKPRPGTLAAHIRPEDWLTLRHLRLAGPINGDDVRLLRRLAGGGGQQAGGCLSTVDLRGAVILTMPDSAFYGCASLTYAALPLTLPEISRFAFAGCAKLNRVDIPPMVNEIKRGAFSGCFNLISADLPGALRTIGASAFNSCNSLTEVRVPQSVTQIGPGAFAHCKKLHTLAVPKSLRNIGRDAVKGTAVTKITRL